jgi:hypothetical protein
MFIMLDSCKHGFGDPKLIREPKPFISLLRWSGVNLFIVVWCRDVKFVRIDAHYWAILLVEAAYLEGVLTTEDYIIVEFIPVFFVKDGDLYRSWIFWHLP